MKVILVAEHASIDFGGEAALPCHYFRVFLAKKIDVCLVVHERSKVFLDKTFPDYSNRIFYVHDSFIHRVLFFLQERLPKRLGNMTFGFCLRMLTQILQKRMVKKLLKNEKDVIVHQVIPVSPKEPSVMSSLGVPVVFGPLNGGMDYPIAFKDYEGKFTVLVNKVGRWLSKPINLVCTGKRRAAAIMVANKRTQNALPSHLQGDVHTIVENGVDLSIWKQSPVENIAQTPTFIFVGRLVDWKAVDLLLEAFFQAAEKVGPMILNIVGDGDQRQSLEDIVSQHSSSPGKVCFYGWLTQTEVAPYLTQATALVLPSLYECGGAVVLEAMASSVPVISTDWGGPSDYLDSECGFLIQPSSKSDLIDGFSDAMVRLSLDSALAKKMGSHGREKIIREYDWEKKADKVIDVYNQYLTASSR